MHPVLIQFTDSFFLSTYGVAIALGLLAAIFMASARAKRRGLPPESIFDFAFVAIIGGFASARLTYIALNWSEFTTDPVGLLFSRSGFVFLGGFVGAAGLGVAYLRWKKLPVLGMGDLVVASLALGHAAGRVGCHFAGCCHGGVCPVPGFGLHVPYFETPDGMVFGNAFTSQRDAGLIGSDALVSLPVWPVQLMESVGLLGLCALLLWFGSRPRRPGQSLALYLIAYSLLRFGLEFLRGDAERGLWFGGALSTSQIVSIGLVLVGVGLAIWSSKQPVVPFVEAASREDQTPAADDDGEGAEARIRARQRQRTAGGK